MDATETERAALVALSSGALWATILAADHPDRIDAIVYIGPAVTLISNHPERDVSPFEDAIETDPEWAKAAGLLAHDYIGFIEFFFSRCFTEPHSSKQIEDCIGWAMQTTPETILDTVLGIGMPRQELFTETCARVRCPTLVIHGDEDQIRPVTQGAALAEATGGQLVTLEGAGHIPNARDPVKVNLLLARVRRRTPSGHIGLEACPSARAPRALHLLADRSRPCAARRRDRRRAAQAAPRPHHRLARSAPGHQGPRGARRADPSRERASSRTSPATSSPSRPSTTCTPSRRSGGWTRSWWRTSWSSTTSSPPSSTTCGSATRPGSSTTTCTRTQS